MGNTASRFDGWNSLRIRPTASRRNIPVLYVCGIRRVGTSSVLFPVRDSHLSWRNLERHSVICHVFFSLNSCPSPDYDHRLFWSANICRLCHGLEQIQISFYTFSLSDGPDAARNIFSMVDACHRSLLACSQRTRTLRVGVLRFQSLVVSKYLGDSLPFALRNDIVAV